MDCCANRTKASDTHINPFIVSVRRNTYASLFGGNKPCEILWDREKLQGISNYFRHMEPHRRQHDGVSRVFAHLLFT